MHAAAHDTFMATAISFYLFTIAATYVLATVKLLQLLSILLHRKNGESVTESWKGVSASVGLNVLKYLSNSKERKTSFYMIHKNQCSTPCTKYLNRRKK